MYIKGFNISAKIKFFFLKVTDFITVESYWNMMVRLLTFNKEGEVLYD